jgi:hypothetical protein
MASYIFFGVVLPERANLTISNARRALEDGDGNPVGMVQIDIDQSQVFILLQTDIQANLHTLRNVAYAHTRVFINAASFFLGGGYELDIVKGFALETGVVETFAPRSPIAPYIADNVKVTIEDVVKATYKVSGRFVAAALEDFADGLRQNGRNAMFFYYRSIESLRQYVGELYQLSKPTAQWEKLREVAKTSRDDIDFIKQFADPVRHGDGSAWDEADMDRAEKITWTALHEVILHKREIDQARDPQETSS